MLDTLIRFSIRNYGVVIAVAFLILIAGGRHFISAGLDIFPEFSPKQVIIQTESPGLSAEQVELLVTQQVEMGVSGVLGLQSIRSESIQGLSIVTASFPEDSDIYRNRQLVSERLASMQERLPKGFSPVVVPLSSSSATVLTLGLTSRQKNLMDLRDLVEWTVKPRLLAVSGIADVNVFGGENRQLQIQADPNQLVKYNLSLDEVIDVVTQVTSIEGVGFVESPNQRFTLQLTGYPATPEQFTQIPINHGNGARLHLGEIATVAYASKPAISAAQIMGKPGIVIMAIAQHGANTLSVSKALEAALAEFKPVFAKEGVEFYPNLFQPADYIERSIANLSKHLLIGGVFVLIVLYAFLFNFRTAIISACAIPVSLLSAALVLQMCGVRLNIMVLGGLAVALGEVVDDAIIDTENIFRRLRENRRIGLNLPIVEVIQSASLEVRGSVVYASFIVALAFVPLLTLDGVAGRLFAPLGISYILAILSSLLVALTLTPALCRILLARNDLSAVSQPLIGFLGRHYKVWLAFANRHFTPIACLAGALCFLTGLAFLQAEHKFLPELREGHYILHTASIPGTSLAESIRIGTRITQQITQIPGIESVSQWAGRAERGADTYGSHYSEYEVRLQPASGKDQQRILDDIHAVLSTFPGLSFEANTFLTERIDETISGYTAPVVVNLYGNDLNDIDRKALVVADIMKSLPTATNVQVRSPPGTPLLQVRLDPDKMFFWGVDARQVRQTLKAAFDTAVVGKQFIGNKANEIAVTVSPDWKQNPQTIGGLMLKSRDGGFVRLDQVADIQPNTGRYNILRQNSQRKQTVTAYVTGDMESFMAALKSEVSKKIDFSADTYPEFTGAAVEQAAARNNLIFHAVLAGIGVLMLIHFAIGRWRHVVLTIVNLPFALLGGAGAVVLTDAPLSVGSVVGFITLFGITVRNSIMLLSHCRFLVNVKGMPWSFDTLVLTAEERLPSILMTALVTALAMLPIALDSDNPGSEIMGPMAAIIIGGLITSTLFNLLLMPCLLHRYGGSPEEENIENH